MSSFGASAGNESCRVVVVITVAVVYDRVCIGICVDMYGDNRGVVVDFAMYAYYWYDVVSVDLHRIAGFNTVIAVNSVVVVVTCVDVRDSVCVFVVGFVDAGGAVVLVVFRRIDIVTDHRFVDIIVV